MVLSILTSMINTASATMNAKMMKILVATAEKHRRRIVVLARDSLIIPVSQQLCHVCFFNLFFKFLNFGGDLLTSQPKHKVDLHA